ncbi:tRNA (adenosine(37)-N6)-threonylcarbamoyltransferase complex dimerization subunit type 1 TsaB [Maribacter algicola]|jgi:tRNA threonylcarbamoyladenosine biosynthesis protein TsaB|uniref:tRNA (Adenosine(37)-N6)-threonylcarbamoyltransferase complex dimerization subunit type 1 TsaB n=1 Tax=Maribacter algicola TaxID=2498892 RepID=A0A426RK79_9FLAO|nr:tRNA (adenosine(37)-N6)-threonylcarbamoyltransferase complex dimerization subunit type 1 TsaB [Maribacter algicola]RRQ49391.1 tRNA (adenosine(37)-N6)-threonylcarbamoyltransferase complex dimerization subunit type 1 TsaB [Maribacter algicola]
MALILNLETATTNCSVCLSLKGEVVSIRENNTPNYSHAEQLHVFIKECMDESGFSMTDLDAIAVSKGPGSYTGLRIGVSAAKGLCFALDVPLISIATLKSLASQLKIAEGDFIIPVLDARRMEVYSAVFDAHLNEIRETQAQIIGESSFQEYLQGSKVHFLGSGAEKIKETLTNSNAEYYTEAVPSAKEMASLSFEKFTKTNFENVAYFEPYYLKDFLITQKKS